MSTRPKPALLQADYPTPNRKALRRVAQIWAASATGYLDLGEQRVVLVYGEPSSTQDLGKIVRAIRSGVDIHFKRVGVMVAPKPPRLAKALWELGLETSPATLLRGTAASRIEGGLGFERLYAFPLHTETLTLAATGDSRVGDAIRLDQQTKLHVLGELSALCTLGVLKIEGFGKRLHAQR